MEILVVALVAVGFWLMWRANNSTKSDSKGLSEASVKLGPEPTPEEAPYKVETPTPVVEEPAKPKAAARTAKPKAPAKAKAPAAKKPRAPKKPKA